VNISEYDRKVNEFDQKRPQARTPGHRIVTWADPMSMSGHFGRTESSSDGYGTDATWADMPEMPFDGGESWARRKLFSSQLQRWVVMLCRRMCMGLTFCLQEEEFRRPQSIKRNTGSAN